MNNTEKDTTAENKQDVEQLEETRDSAQTDGKDEKKEIVYIDDHHTVADMNVEGFSWYNPNMKAGKKPVSDLTDKEYWAMVGGAFRAMLPMFICILVGAVVMFLIALLWLK